MLWENICVCVCVCAVSFPISISISVHRKILLVNSLSKSLLHWLWSTVGAVPVRHCQEGKCLIASSKWPWLVPPSLTDSLKASQGNQFEFCFMKWKAICYSPQAGKWGKIIWLSQNSILSPMNISCVLGLFYPTNTIIQMQWLPWTCPVPSESILGNMHNIFS